jgi:diguanylate cyclase (GGDEF)-like protein
MTMVDSAPVAVSTFESSGGRAMRILLVDDSPLSQTMVTHLLRAGGFDRIASAESASEAFALLGLGDLATTPAPPVDLILMDYDMPGMSGLEATRRLKADPRVCDIPVIMVTAQTEDAYVKASFDAGAVDYVSKPPRSVELLARIQSALRLKSEMDQRRAREQEVLSLVHQLQAANQRLESLATLDGLTGIPNRRKLDEILDCEWRRHGRTGSPIALLMIDVDFFKRYNDTCGHLAGDACLQRVADGLKGRVRRAGDVLARFGGEEFAVVLPSTDLSGACVVGETLRAAVQTLGIPHATSDVAASVTVSVGAASMTPGGCQVAMLIAAADAALYQAKAQGRNQVAGRTPHCVGN